MKASELVNQINKLIKAHGDQDIHVFDDEAAPEDVRGVILVGDDPIEGFIIADRDSFDACVDMGDE